MEILHCPYRSAPFETIVLKKDRENRCIPLFVREYVYICLLIKLRKPALPLSAVN
jgi:hypothetical protein